MPLCNILRRANKKKRGDEGDEEDIEIDLNTTLEDEVFLPGPAPIRTGESWVVDPKVAKRYETPGQRFRKFIKPAHKPNIVGNVYPDPLFGSKRVKQLDDINIYDYILRKDTVLLMFYESVNEKLPANAEWSRNQLVQAAESTKPSGRGYATLDCTRESYLCDEIRHVDMNRKAKEFPFFNLFIKGKLTQSITDYKTLDAARMRQLVENKGPDFDKK